MYVAFKDVKLNGIFMYNGYWYSKCGARSAKDPERKSSMIFTFDPEARVYVDNHLYVAA